MREDKKIRRGFALNANTQQSRNWAFIILPIFLITIGCSSTNRFVVSEDPLVKGKVSKVYVPPTKRPIIFDEIGGLCDFDANVIIGICENGDPVKIEMEDVSKIILEVTIGGEKIKEEMKLDALNEGESWEPKGAIEKVVLNSGRIIKFKEKPPLIDINKRIIRFISSNKRISEIPFKDLLYVQFKEKHPGKTGLLILGVPAFFATIFFIKIAIEMKEWSD